MLKIDQQCCNWSILRQFRITVAVAGQILVNDRHVAALLGKLIPTQTEQTLVEKFKGLQMLDFFQRDPQKL